MDTNKIDAKLAEDTLNILSEVGAHPRTGNRDGEDSISSLMDRLRDRGWMRLGNAADLESDLERLGFSIRRVTDSNGSIRRTFIGLEG